MSQVMDIKQTAVEIETFNHKFKQKEPPRDGPANVGELFRQGDVYIARIEDSCVPTGENARPYGNGSGQVVEGTTQGSRHIMTGDYRLIADPDAKKSDLLGPFVSVGEEGAVLTHPEHADCRLSEGSYRIGYQLDEATRFRVRD